jgi:hypothetical protein
MSLPQQRVLFRRLIGRRRSTSRRSSCFNSGSLLPSSYFDRSQIASVDLVKSGVTARRCANTVHRSRSLPTRSEGAEGADYVALRKKVLVRRSNKHRTCSMLNSHWERLGVFDCWWELARSVRHNLFQCYGQIVSPGLSRTTTQVCAKALETRVRNSFSDIQLKIVPFLPDTLAHGLLLISLMEAKASRRDKTYSYRRR